MSQLSPFGGLSSWLWFLFGSGSDGANANIATGLGSPNGASLIAGLVATPDDERERPERKRTHDRDPALESNPRTLQARSHRPAWPHHQPNESTSLDHRAALDRRTRFAHRDAGVASRRPVVILATPINWTLSLKLRELGLHAD